MKYNKLVRDRIPEIIENKGERSHFHIADEKEYQEKLKEKLQEEVDEFLKSEQKEEIADILEVIEAIKDYKGFTWQEILKIKGNKAEERGRFIKRIILDES